MLHQSKKLLANLLKRKFLINPKNLMRIMNNRNMLLKKKQMLLLKNHQGMDKSLHKHKVKDLYNKQLNLMKKFQTKIKLDQLVINKIEPNKISQVVIMSKKMNKHNLIVNLNRINITINKSSLLLSKQHQHWKVSIGQL